MNRKKGWLLGCILAFLWVGGCLAPRGPLEDLGVVRALALDVGEEKALRASLSLVGEEAVFAGEGDTLEEALGELARRHSRTPYLGSTGVIVLGRDLAEKDLSGLFASLAGESRQNKGEHLILSTEEGAALLEIEDLAELVEESALRGWTVTALLKDVGQAMAAPGGGSLVPVVSPEGRVETLALLSRFCCRGYLTEEERAGARWLLGKVEEGGMTLKADGVAVGGRVSGRGWVECLDGAEGPVFLLQAKAEFTPHGPGSEEQLTAALQEKLAGQMQAAAACAARMEADFLGWGAAAQGTRPEWMEEYGAAWGALLKEWPCMTRVEGKILRQEGGGDR